MREKPNTAAQKANEVAPALPFFSPSGFQGNGPEVALTWELFESQDKNQTWLYENKLFAWLDTSKQTHHKQLGDISPEVLQARSQGLRKG